MELGTTLAVGAVVPGGGTGLTVAEDLEKGAKAGKEIEELVRTGRGKNHLYSDPQAAGPHSTFRRNPQGDVSHHAEWTPNPHNPRGWDELKRVDLEGGSHTNSATKQKVLTPHTHDRKVPGGVREAQPDELPEKLRR